jgi:hypothetical protein
MDSADIDLATVPAREERLSRFIFTSRHYAAATGRVKPAAFLPSPSLETSVFRTRGLGRPDLLRIGGAVGAAGSRVLKAWADVLAGTVFDAGLQVDPDDDPPRHATIVGWRPGRMSSC